MPNYDFKCNTCEHKFSLLVSIADKDKVKCPRCGSGSVRQLFTGFALGSGKGKAPDCASTCGTGG